MTSTYERVAVAADRFPRPDGAAVKAFPSELDRLAVQAWAEYVAGEKPRPPERPPAVTFNPVAADHQMAADPFDVDSPALRYAVAGLAGALTVGLLVVAAAAAVAPPERVGEVAILIGQCVGVAGGVLVVLGVLGGLAAGAVRAWR